MALTKLKLTPGFTSTGTRYSDQTKWYSGNNVRFVKSAPESIGGWVQISPNMTLKGIARSIFTWHSKNGTIYTGVGTDWKYYIVYGGTAYDITPLSKTVSSNIRIDTDGTNIVSVTYPTENHDAIANDFLEISGVTTGELTSLGVTDADLNAEQQILDTPSLSSFRFKIPNAATKTFTLYPASATTIKHQINTGKNVSLTTGTGWGSGGWGTGGWGRSSDSIGNEQIALRLWSEGIDGENLILSNTYGKIYYWNVADNTKSGVPDAGGRAVDLDSYGTSKFLNPSSVPTNNAIVLYTSRNNRIISFGTQHIGDTSPVPMLIRWSDNDLNDNGFYDWYPRVTNSAGGQILVGGSRIVAAREMRDEILVWTDTSLHSMRSTAPPVYFSFKKISDNASIASPRAVAIGDDTAFWMAPNSFFMYSGTIKRLPQDVDDYVFSDINIVEAYKIFSSFNKKYTEITWFYCSADSKEIDRYVTFNYSNGSWTYGNMDMSSMSKATVINTSTTYNRTSWEENEQINRNYATFVYQLDESQSPPIELTGIYEHERGVSADGRALQTLLKTPEIEIGEGDKFMYVNRIIPDVSFVSGDLPESSGDGLKFSVNTKRYPHDTGSSTSVKEVLSTTEKVDIRARGRVVSVDFSSDTSNQGWSMGAYRFDIRPDGRS